MKLFDNLPGLGRDDPLERTLEERQNQENGADKNTDADGDDWPFAYNEVETQSIAGNEVHSISEEGTHYAGSYVRQMIENRRYNPDGYTWFGYTKHPVRGVEAVGVPHNALFKHTALFGVTGFGKSTVMKNMMLQWIHANYGMCFIDPKGDDSQKLLSQIPEHRRDDLVWVELGQTERDQVVGFNFFDTYTDPDDPKHEQEVDEIVSDFVGILKNTTSGWGATMENVARAVTKQLVKSEESYNIVDLYKILNNEDEREAFAEHFGDEVEQMYLNRLAEMDSDEFDPIIRRVREWVENSVTREIIAHEGSQLNLTEAVESGKILLINTADIPDKNIKRLISTAVIRRIWSTIRTRTNIPEEERDPYFLCIDEFDQVAGEGSDIEDILSKARSLRMSVFVANQQPNQLPDSIRDAVYGNCNNLFTFNPGPANFKDAKPLSQALGDIETHKLLGLSQFQLLGRVTIGQNKTDAMLIHTFPEYPPIRDEEGGEELKQESIEKYGTERKLDTADTGEYGILARVEGEEDDDSVEINEDGDRVTPRQVLECVHAAGIRHETREIDGKQNWVHEDDLKAEIVKYAGDIGYDSVLDNVIEKIPETKLDRTLDGDVYFRLTAKGEEEAFIQDTGTSASGGKNAHRVLLQEGHRAFTKLGYNVTLPTQEGDQLPDGLASPPYDPVEESETWEEAKQLRERLQDDCPRLWQLFGDSTVSLEAESTTIEKPKQTIKNLAKAVRKGQKCVFLVKDGTHNHGEMDHWARVGTNILTSPPFVAGDDDDGNRTFYNTSQMVELSDGSRALQRVGEGGRSECVWKEIGKSGESSAGPGDAPGKIILAGDDEPVATFDDASDLKDPNPSDFPYHYYRNNSEHKTVVKDRNGRVVGEYDNKTQMKEDGFRPVYKPLLPDHIFPGGELPPRDSWMFVIIPSGERRGDGPMIYDNGTLIPLFSNEIPSTLSDADRNTGEDRVDAPEDGLPTGNTTPRNPTTATSSDGDEASETDTPEPSDEPRVADPDEPKSNTDVVKESGEVWTKPEEGDDDYNPAKDNSNYRVGYDEEHTDADYTGGNAREADKQGDFDEYEMPEKHQNLVNDDMSSDSLNDAAVEGMIENDGELPEFRDERSTDETETDADPSNNTPSGTPTETEDTTAKTTKPSSTTDEDATADDESPSNSDRDVDDGINQSLFDETRRDVDRLDSF